MYYYCSRCSSKVEYAKRCSCSIEKRKEKIKKYKEKYNDKDSFYRTQRWRKLRKRVLERDNYLCVRCLHKYNIFNSENLEAHHVKSRKNYPELELDMNNIVCVCKTCNLQLGTADSLDFEYRTNTLSEDFNLY